MANILTSYPIRYTQDEAHFGASGLVISNSTNYIDLSNADNVTGFTFNTSQPTGTDIRMLFKTNDTWFKLDANGAAVEVDTQDLTAESVLEEGNSIAELDALTSIPAFVNSRVHFAVALSSDDPDNSRPMIKFAVNAMNSTQTAGTTAYSPEYNFENDIVITGTTTDASTSSGGTLNLAARYYNDNGELTDWQALTNLTGIVTKHVEFRAIMNAAEIGTSRSTLNSIKMNYNEGGIIAANTLTSEIYTVTEDWRVKLRHCRVVVRHNPLGESDIKAYVSMRTKSIKVTGEELGTATGTRQTFTLEHINGLKLDSIKVFVNGALLYGGYDVNCQTGRITLTSEAGNFITCNYEYGWESEDWQEMPRDLRESFDNYDMSQYRIIMPETENERSIAAIKLELIQINGHIDNESIGEGTGELTTYALSQNVDKGAITITSNGQALDDSRYKLQEDTKYIQINGDIGAALAATYDYISTKPVIYQIGGVFSE